MRLLHTADWHMKDKLGWQDRTEDINRSLTEIAEILVERSVEVMIVAGDIFRERLSRDELREAVADLARIFGPWLASGGTIVAVAGNHDNRAQLETLRDALKLAPGANTGRIHLFTNAGSIDLTDRAGQVIQFACLPYPDEAFLRGEWESAGEANRSRQDTCQKTLERLYKKLDVTKKTVFVSHMHVHGVPIGARDDHQIGAEDDVQITISDLPISWASYLAFGHIHKPQMIVGLPRARYSGSVQRLDAGEKCDEKGVLLLDIDSREAPIVPEWIPLQNVSEIVVLTLNGEADLETLTEHLESLVSAIVRCTPGIDNFSRIKRRLRELYPRLYAVREERLSSGGQLPETTGRESRTPAENVREFLRHAPGLSNREALLTLVEEILL